MKINPINTMAGLGKTRGLNAKNAPLKNRTEIAADKFIFSNNNDKNITYTKGAVKTNETMIASLKEESEKAYASLRRLVTELLERQGYSAERVKDKGPVAIEIDAAARIEAAELIADDGPLGAEAVSNRIVDFAIAVVGGDKSKMALIKDAIDKGFGQVKNMLGGLPEVSLRTYDLIMEKLDRREKEEP